MRLHKLKRQKLR